ncbi:Lysosomal Pro-X carboxypeptidase [Holothuria leucospilota]|uniref:Lysosomal Pro-X carboxypeptidase n=1 Tax=Holothuria leucospilota TaxID=206669 RepID=A0A9Q1H052_HOLLE|nr:Lysosomal Pro-X carboxypeptidase [Holothuria leucospilota]
MDMKLDHFDFTNDQTFKLRYFIADSYQSIQNRPIFFYTGNEGDIVLFCNNTGILWDMAPEFNAVVIFAEHRYYGKTLPFGSESYKDASHLKYLSSEQALADFAYVVKMIKDGDPTLARSPVITFGGSYGGMLAAWMRMKYPNVIAGALAASAPIWNFVGQLECNAAYKIITKDFEMSGDNCKPGIRSSWDVLNKMGQTEKGREQIMSLLSLCDPLPSKEDVQQVKDWLAETWFNLAMVDYPYPANFLEPLPGFPIKVVCSKFTSPNATGADLLLEMKDALGVYYNYTGQASCFNISQTESGSLSETGWNWQSCTEMVMPFCTDGVTDMFEPSPWDFNAYVRNCQTQFGVTPRDDWVEMYYWGKNITTASNIFFSNGALDPWSAGGVLKSQSETLQAFVIPEGAHHLDIRSKTDKDPPGLIQARKMEKDAIYKWIKDYHKL